MKNRHLWVTILAGGIGSRFWPVSTPTRPKQLLPLASSDPLIVDTVDRARQLVPDARIRMLTGRAMVPPIRSVLPDLPDGSYLVEPRARGTAPVLAWAAWTIAREDPESVLVSLHSDHVIRPTASFVSLIEAAAEVSRRHRRLLTIAVSPDRPETGYGYIRPGPPLDAPEGTEAFEVEAFVEKPDLETAARYVDAGYVWNSGIFVWPAAVFLEELERHAPSIAAALPLLEDGDVDGFFETVPTATVDEEILERSNRVGTVRANFRWDDVGSWEALSRTRKPDDHGNVCVGTGLAIEARDNIMFSDAGPIVALGVRDLVIVQAQGMTMVIPREEAPNLKRYLKELPDEVLRGAAS